MGEPRTPKTEAATPEPSRAGPHYHPLVTSAVPVRALTWRRRRGVWQALAAGCLGALAAGSLSGVPSPAGADGSTYVQPLAALGRTVAVPTVIGPVSGGTPDIPVNGTLPSVLRQYGYSEKEYFIKGTATAYRPVGTWGANGRWRVATASTAPYETRILVRVPTDPKKFSGTVVFEWYNETSGRDADPDFGFTYPELMRAGDAYVGVSAQALGVVGSSAFSLPIPNYHPVPLVVQNPARYGALHHPGDQYAYDIFSQAAQAVLRPRGARPLGALKPRVLIADGESQSASELVTYINAIAPVDDIFDGYLVHSRGAGGAALNPALDTPVPKVARFRTDLGRPVLIAETETDPFGIIGYQPAIQPDSSTIRLWEMAGTSHVDQWTLHYGITSGVRWDPGVPIPTFRVCGSINDGPERFVMRAAVAALDRWVTTGVTPAPAPRFAINPAGTAIVRDRYGNAVGGIRNPDVTAPISALSGVFNPDTTVICALFGSSKPFSPALLHRLYPTHADYVAKVAASAAAAVRRGYLLPQDAARMVALAKAAHVPG